MAWVAIHDSIDGPKLRNFCKLIGCSQCEAEGILSKLWRWGKENASDDDGKILYADKEDIAVIFNGVVSKSLQPSHIVDSLIKAGWIDENGDDLYIHDWCIWQEQWIKAKLTRAKDAQRKREERKKAKEIAQNSISPVKEISDVPLNEKNNSKQKSSRNDYPEKFEEFWSVYPKKSEKGNAYKKYKARINDGYSPEELIEAAKNYAEEMAFLGTEIKYIKGAKSFLSDSTPFTDYLPKNSSTDDIKNGDNPYAEWKG